MKKHILSLPLWGKDYIDIFLTYSLPTHLAKGNLPYLKSLNEDFSIIIYTNEESRDYLLQKNVDSILGEYGKVSFFLMNQNIIKDGKYSLLSWSINKTLEVAYKSDIPTVCYFSQADAIYSTDFFRFFNENNIKILLEHGLWVDGNKISDFLTGNNRNGRIEIDSQALAIKAMNSLHESCNSYNFKSNNFNFHASGIFYNTPECMISKYFHIYPIIIEADKTSPEIYISKGYTPDNCPDFFNSDAFDDAYILSDSKEVFVFGIEFFHREEKAEYFSKVNPFLFSSLMHKIFFKNHLRAFNTEIIYGYPEKADAEFFKIADEMRLFGELTNALIKTGADVYDFRLELFYAEVEILVDNKKRMLACLNDIASWVDALHTADPKQSFADYGSIEKRLAAIKEKVSGKRPSYDECIAINDDINEILTSIECGRFTTNSIFIRLHEIINKKYSRYVLYGYGEYGRILEQMLKAMNIYDITIIDDNILDVENIISFDKFRQNVESNSIVFLCTANKSFMNTMLLNLSNLPAKDDAGKIEICDDFFDIDVY